MLRAVPEDAISSTIKGLPIAGKSGYSLEDLVAAVVARKKDERSDASEPAPGLRDQEYQALVRGRPETSPDQDFVCVPLPVAGTGVSTWFSNVMAVPRLREVRALESFTRLIAPSPSDLPERRAALFSENPGWLPALEVTGEGVFIVLDQNRIKKWETRVEVRDRIRTIADNYRNRFLDVEKAPDRTITPRFVLLHTLAHLVVIQWSLECGYPAAALRERVYADDEMAGFLVYTATSDSAGV